MNEGPEICIETNAATSVGETAALLHLTANAHGRKGASVAIEYQSFPLESTEAHPEGEETNAAETGQIPISGSSNQEISFAVSGLRPDTAYYFKALSWLPEGGEPGEIVNEEPGEPGEEEPGEAPGPERAAEGAELTFHTVGKPLPPVVSTEAAEAIEATAATLTGSVNPNGQATTYFFQYGETASYGLMTPEVAAGSAESAETRSAVISGLAPGRTYHYRIVARSIGGEALGADHTFKTLAASYKVSAVIAADGARDAYFRGNNGAIWQATNSGAVKELGGTAVGTPAAVALPSGEQDVYYRNPNGTIWDWSLNAATNTWSDKEMGGTAAGDPAVAPGNPYSVFFRASEGCISCIDQLYREPSGKWHTEPIGGEASGDPTAVTNAAGTEQVWWVGGDGSLWMWSSPHPTEGGWKVKRVGGRSMSEKPAVVWQTATTESVYFRASEGCIECIDQLHWDGSSWATNEIGGQATGAPVAAPEGEGLQHIYWRGSNEQIWDQYWRPGHPWEYAQLAGPAGGSPAQAYSGPAANTTASLFYSDPTGDLKELALWNGEWHPSQICAWSCGAHSLPARRISAVVLPNGSRDIYFLGDDGGIWQETSYGTVRELGGHAVGTPAAVALANGEQDVYFRGVDGAMWEWSLNPSTEAWTLKRLGGEPGGSPAVTAAYPHNVFFVSSKNCIQCMSLDYETTGGVWNWKAVGGQPIGEPAAVSNPTTGAEQVWWEQSNGNYYVASAASPGGGGEWSLKEVGGTPTADPPALIWRPDGSESVFFRAREGCVWCIDQLYTANGTSWSSFRTDAVGGNSAGPPVAAEEAGAQQSVYFRGVEGGHLWEMRGTASRAPSEAGWGFLGLPGSLAGDPAEAYSSAYAPTPTNLYFFNSSGGISTLAVEANPSAREICSWSCVPKTAPTPADTTAPHLSTQSPQQGVALSTTNGTWTNSPTSYTYKWERCNAGGTNCSVISGAASSSYTPVEADEGSSLRTIVTAVNASGSAVAISAATNPLAYIEKPVNTKLPQASPTPPLQSVTESTTTGTWRRNPTSYAYQWERCSQNGTECVAIGQATSSTYTPVEADAEHTLVVKVTATNPKGSTSALSAATALVKKLGQRSEYGLPTGSGPFGIAPGADGNLWFADVSTAKIGKVTPTGAVSEYALPAGSVPIDTAKGSDGNEWFSEEATGKIGKITPSGTITEYTLPAGSKPYDLTEGPGGAVWFAERAGKIGKITTSGAITEYPVSGAAIAITAGPDGNVWFTLYWERVGKITPSGVVSEYAVPSGSHPEGIVAGPDGNLWFTDSGTSKVGKITTSGAVTEYALLSGSAPQGITSGPDGRLWIAEPGTSKIARMTTIGGLTEYALPSGSSPGGIAVGPEDEIWFTDGGTSKVGEIAP